mmetsp:Transcript_95491/g.165883  ORF Transcript_95491/g.165883 Transcript_95491/m.165883 type:complete len:269 (+) Transcript_95491:114-920(+)
MAFRADHWRILGLDCCCITEEDDTGEQAVHAVVMSNSHVNWKALRSTRWQTRREAVASLGLCEVDKERGVSHDVLAALRAAFKDDHWQVRRQSAYSLQQLGEVAVHEALPVLWHACGDQDACVRTAALSVLQAYGQDTPSNDLRVSRLLRAQMLHEKETRLESVKETTYEREGFTGLSKQSSGLSQKAAPESRIDTGSTTEGSGFRTDTEEVFPYRLERPRACPSHGPSAMVRSFHDDQMKPSALTERAAGDDEDDPEPESSVYIAAI